MRISQYLQKWFVQNSAWVAQHKDHIYITRYVDNRLVIAPAELYSTPELQELCDLNFYKTPVELQAVTDLQFLGTFFHAPDRRLEFIQPEHNFQFRPYLSAGSLNHRVAALNSRLCSASRISFPLAQTCQDLSVLCDKYIQQGFPPALVQKRMQHAGLLASTTTCVEIKSFDPRRGRCVCVHS